jgi:hypothetical protein
MSVSSWSFFNKRTRAMVKQIRAITRRTANAMIIAIFLFIGSLNFFFSLSLLTSLVCLETVELFVIVDVVVVCVGLVSTGGELRKAFGYLGVVSIV